MIYSLHDDFACRDDPAVALNSHRMNVTTEIRTSPDSVVGKNCVEVGSVV